MNPRVYTQTFAVVGAILERDGKFLLVREAGKHADAGKWNQPAGWLDVGEDPIAAARREVEEETGLLFEPTALVGIYSLARQDLARADGSYPHGVKLIFAGEIRGGHEHGGNDEISEVRWFSPAEIHAMDHTALRDVDIKREIDDHAAGRRYPLSIVAHTVVSSDFTSASRARRLQR